MTPALHHRTPTVSAVDPRGLPLVVAAYHRRDTTTDAETRIERQAFDALGRLAGQWDARLWADSGGEPNQSTLYSLSGHALRTISVDSGWRIALLGDAGQAMEGWDGRGTHRRTVYDDQLRPVSVHEQLAGTSTCCVERLAYGGPCDAAANRCRLIRRHDEPSGSRTVQAYDLLGRDKGQTQRFLQALEIPDWPGPEAERDTLLETDDQGRVMAYTTRWAHDPLGMPIGRIDAVGNEQIAQHDVAGQLSRMSLRAAGTTKADVLLDALDYDASGRALTQTAGNGVITAVTCSVVDGRLQESRVHRPDRILQALRYTCDPVGNLLAVKDDAQATDWYNGEEVNAINEYRFDTLYQLVEARGREAARAGIQPGLPDLMLPGGGDMNRRRNFTQTYTYDAGGNLLTLGHTQVAPRKMKVAARSNRSLYMPDENQPPDIDPEFDANGNLLRLEGAQPMTWNARNQLQRVAQVVRDDGINDDETYVYGANGQRCRKIRCRWARDITHLAQVKYLPGLEIRTNTATGELLHVATVQAGQSTVSWLDWRQSRKAMPLPQWRYRIDDHLASSSLELDGNADVVSHEGYYPYGGTAWWAARSAIDAACKTIRYSGKERDATGLYYYGFRYYAPWLLRWINTDPAGDVDGLNLFGFVRNSPIVNIDVDGRGLEQVPGMARLHLLKWAEENYQGMAPDEWRKQLREKIRPHVSTGKDKVIDEIQRLVTQSLVRRSLSGKGNASSSRLSDASSEASSSRSSGVDVNERAHQLMWKSNFLVFQEAAEAILNGTPDSVSATFDRGTPDTIRGFHGAQGIFDSARGKNKGPLKDAVKSLMKKPPVEVAQAFNALLAAEAKEDATTLYRGTAMSPEGLFVLKSVTKNGGAPLRATRFVATSSDIEVARRFSRMDAGTPVLFHVRGWAQHMGSEAAESEHVFPYGSVFLVEHLRGNEFRMTYKPSMSPIGPLPY